MIIVNYTMFRNNMKRYFDGITKERKHVIVNRQGEENVMMISMDEWNEIQKQLSNLAYLRKLEESEKQVAEGKVIVKTIEQLEDLENE